MRFVSGGGEQPTYRISPHGAGLLQYVDGSVEEWLKCAANGQSNVSEAAQDEGLDTSVKDGTLQICEQYFHKTLTIRYALIAKGSADIANESDRYGTQLVFLVRVQSSE